MLDYRNTTDGTDETTAMETTDDPQRTGTVVYQAGADQTLSTAVAFAIAEFRGVDPVELAGDTVLGRTVDLTMLDSLSPGAEAGAAWTFDFTLPTEEHVTVESDGRVTVTSA